MTIKLASSNVEADYSVTVSMELECLQQKIFFSKGSKDIYLTGRFRPNFDSKISTKTTNYDTFDLDFFPTDNWRQLLEAMGVSTSEEDCGFLEVFDWKPVSHIGGQIGLPEGFFNDLWAISRDDKVNLTFSYTLKKGGALRVANTELRVPYFEKPHPIRDVRISIDKPRQRDQNA